MTEQIPFWEDWRFWQIVVTGALALVGFFLAAWAKYLFDLRLDARRRDHEESARKEQTAVFAIAIRAELIGLMDDAAARLDTVEAMLKTKGPVYAGNIAPLDISDKPVYRNNTHRVGDLGRPAVLNVVTAHACADHIRNNVASARSHPIESIVEPEILVNFGIDLQKLLEMAATAVNALHDLLGEPKPYRDPKRVLEQIDSEGADG